MFRSVRSDALDVSGVLSALPITHLAYFHDSSWLVTGPTGLFVVLADEGDLLSAADAAIDRAQMVRSRLAGELALVPFVDAVVVTGREEIPTLSPPCLITPIDRLVPLITDGPRLVDDRTLAMITRIQMRSNLARPD